MIYCRRATARFWSRTTGPVRSIESATRNSRRVAALIGTACLIALATPDAHAASGDKEAGRQKAEVCTPCHGVTGVSAMPGVPSLAGQTDQFLQWQLVFFRSGRRQSE